ncbi:hypothetical protein BTO30_10445 [Domibacillus antri]|uniref:GGDEF domain-containing protein n=1 Tax=Domibacillus antri TaxID=1714264 RepID=A0A1Q8Q491_9BACI|nr:EAL domain-containing protein [Domibacillus antri]OLN22164.1 hypothetical protein BTO30_10445 [Domibacillus antri]
MDYQDIHYYKNLDSIAIDVLELLSEMIQVNTIFFSGTDHQTNYIFKSYNRQAVLSNEGDNKNYKDALCHLVIENAPGPLVIPDLKKHPLTKDHPVTRQLGNGGFLGVPVYTENREIFGTLCALDSKPYEFDVMEVKQIKVLASLLSQTIIMEKRLIRDSLTGLYNRHFIKEYFHYKDIEASSNMGVLYIDLDHFKRINDTFGHAMGDDVLNRASAIFKNSSPSNSIVARLGGDEFVILVPEYTTEYHDIKELAERILHTLSSEQIQMEGEEFVISASIGVSCYPKDGQDMETLLKQADVSMYAAKKRGRNNVQFYQQGINDSDSRYYKLENAMRKALKKEEFEVYYQPQYDLQQNKLVGMEALLRWNHPEWGVISPNEFIPIAEESGLIEKIGEWVLRSVCKQGMVWEKQGIAPICLSVNLSPRQFENTQLAEQIRLILEETGYDPAFLKLELTEGMLINDVEYALTVIKALKRMGIHIVVDDFGKGYSSLSYLSQFPIDCLKLDRSFTLNLDNDVNQKIAKAVISLAHSLEILAIAEGIETEEQLQFLKDHGCGWGQGYYLGIPKPVNEIGY